MRTKNKTKKNGEKGGSKTSIDAGHKSGFWVKILCEMVAASISRNALTVTRNIVE